MNQSILTGRYLEYQKKFLLLKRLHLDCLNTRVLTAWLHSKRDALSSNRKVDGSRLTGNTQAFHS